MPYVLKDVIFDDECDKVKKKEANGSVSCFFFIASK
jgi:hypothetical protein